MSNSYDLYRALFHAVTVNHRLLTGTGASTGHHTRAKMMKHAAAMLLNEFRPDTLRNVMTDIEKEWAETNSISEPRPGDGLGLRFFVRQITILATDPRVPAPTRYRAVNDLRFLQAMGAAAHPDLTPPSGGAPTPKRTAPTADDMPPDDDFLGLPTAPRAAPPSDLAGWEIRGRSDRGGNGEDVNDDDPAQVATRPGD